MLWLRNVTGVQLYGYGGNACPALAYPPGFAQYRPSLFRIEASRDVTLVNLVSYDMASTLATSAGDGAVISCLAPDRWVSVVERHGDSNESTRPLDRPALYRRR